MDIRQLTAFVTVADVGSVTKAATLLRQVQPAVTRQIQALEDELGVVLFTRSPRGMTPTTDGLLLLDRARRALAELDRARAELRGGEPRRLRGIVTVGVLESLVELVVPHLITSCASRYPEVDLRVVAGYSGHLQQWLNDGDVDLSLLYNVPSSGALVTRRLLEEPLWAIAPASAGLTSTSPVLWHQLCEQPLVLPLPGHGLRVLIDQARAALDVTLNVSVQTNSLTVQKLLVQAGHGWTVLPSAGMAPDIQAGRLSGAPLRDPQVTRQVVLAYHHAAGRSAAVRVVAQLLQVVVGAEVRGRTGPACT